MKPFTLYDKYQLNVYKSRQKKTYNVLPNMIQTQQGFSVKQK